MRNGKKAAKVLVEADARFLRDAGRIGIERVEKTLYLRLDLLVARWDDDTWLDVAVHFRLHSCFIPEKLSLSFQGSRDPLLLP